MNSTKQKAHESQGEKLIFKERTNKNFVAVFVGVLLVAVVSIVVINKLLSSGDASDNRDLELKLVHLIFRHGDRTPVTPTYPLDPYINETYEPYGHGQLTQAGIYKSYHLGKFFKKRYENFLGPAYEQNKIYAQSTDYKRTKLSLQLVASGMFSLKNEMFDGELDLNWQPTDFIVEKPDNNSLLYPLHTPCKRFLREFSANYAPVIAKNRNVFELFENFTGKPFVGPFDTIKLYYDLKTQVEYGLNLPLWASEYFPEKLSALSNEAWGYMGHSEVWKRIYGGPMLKRLIDDWEANISGTSPKKIVMWSGHDSTVVGVLGGFNVWNKNDSPDYGITAIFELRQNRKTDEYGVQVYVRNEPNDEPLLLTIPGCDSFCPLSKLKLLLLSHLPRADDCD